MDRLESVHYKGIPIYISDNIESGDDKIIEGEYKIMWEWSLDALQLNSKKQMRYPDPGPFPIGPCDGGRCGRTE